MPFPSLRTTYYALWASEEVIVVKNLPANAGALRDAGSVLGLGRSPGGGPGSPLQYSCLENPMDRGAWRGTLHRVTKSPTWLKQLSRHPPCTRASLHSSVGKESACSAGDLTLIPGLGRTPGEGIGYPLQYSWASLVAQLVKNPLAVWETWVWSLGWEDSPGEGKGYPLQYSGLEYSMDCMAHGVTKSRT